MDTPANIFKLQAQVLASDGQTGPSLPRAGLREQLGESTACHKDAEPQGHLRQAAAQAAAGCVLQAARSRQTGDEKCQHICKLPTERERPPQ